MHPPAYRPDHLLSDWPACHLEIHCCKGQTLVPIRLLIATHGDRSFTSLLARLRCSRCGGRPAPVYLCAGHREHCGGAPADWAVELVPRRGP